MTERERLLKILNVPIYPHENVDPLEAVTDYLLDNGVRIPVRCKDCIHYDFSVCLKIYSDGAVSQYAWQARKEDDFCSYGERKVNEEQT